MFYKVKTKARSQRGAMFGLDARIALAIFAGLSIIAGMAVVSTVRKTDVTSLTSEFDNISKGYLNFAFDTGVDIPVASSADGQGGFTNLYTDADSTLNWKGPYITRSTFKHPKYGNYSLILGSIDASWDPTSPASTGSIPGVWLDLSSVPCEIAGNLDTQIDGSASGSDGNLRYDDTCSSGDNVTVAYLLSRTVPTD